MEVLFAIILFVFLFYVVKYFIKKLSFSQKDKPMKYEEVNEENDFENPISKIIDQADKYFHSDKLQEALHLYKQAINCASDAPTSKSEHENIDLGDVGFACWSAFVCKDVLNELEGDDFLELLKLIERKSPLTASRIKERLNQTQEDIKIKNEMTALEDKIIQLARGEQPDTKSISKQVRQYCNVCKDWWRLRDLANVLVKTSPCNNTAWSLYNRALIMGRFHPSIYESMGRLRRKEGNYFDATKLFLLSFAGSKLPTKSCENQIRICLINMGFKDKTEEIKDNLISMVIRKGKDEALEKLESLKKAQLKY